MSSKTIIAGAALAGLLSGAYASQTTSSSNDSGQTAAKAGTLVLKDSLVGENTCKGKNECKGKGGCKSGDNGCKGKNSCKGKGGCATKPEPKK